MGEYKIEQPVIRQVKFAYQKQGFPDKRDCYFYEFYANWDGVLIPDGDFHFLWDVTKKSRICFDNEGGFLNQICFFNGDGHRYFGIAIAPDFLLERDWDLEVSVTDWLKEGMSFQELVDFFNKRLSIDAHLKCNHPLIVYGIKRMLETQGRISVESIAMERNYTTRQMERIFKDYYACSPKGMCRFIRIGRALDLIEKERDCVFSSVSERLGFADASHFQREFKHFTGVPPRQFAIHYFNRKYD